MTIRFIIFYELISFWKDLETSKATNINKYLYLWSF